MKSLIIGYGSTLSPDVLFNAAREETLVELSGESVERVNENYQALLKLSSENVIYGVNTGFGDLASERIPSDKLSDLQKRLIFSHSAGSGKPYPPQIVRMAMIARAHSLALGYSGISLELIERLLKLINEGVTPIVPEEGSVGASGDLIPLAHIALALIGEGEVFYRGERMRASQTLRLLNLTPYELRPKEGLALINGTCFSAAIATAWLIPLRELLSYAMIAHVLSLVALGGLSKHYHSQIFEVKPHRGLKLAGERIRELLSQASWRERDAVQDPYSLRCAPHAYGYGLDFISWAHSILQVELNSVTDNPILSGESFFEGGNFHGNYLAMISDHARAVISQLSELSFWRTSRLLDQRYSNGLPPFLAGYPGLDSGFMITHYLMSNLNAELKALAVPVSLNNSPVSAMQEDWVTYAQTSSTLTLRSLHKLVKVIAMEMMVAVQGILRREVRLRGELKDIYEELVELAGGMRSSDLAEPIYGLQERYVVWLMEKVKLGWYHRHLEKGRGLG